MNASLRYRIAAVLLVLSRPDILSASARRNRAVGPLQIEIEGVLLAGQGFGQRGFACLTRSEEGDSRELLQEVNDIGVVPALDHP